MPGVEDWVNHPDALDRILHDMAKVSARYLRASDETRLNMCGDSQALFYANERLNAKFGIPDPRRDPRRLWWVAFDEDATALLRMLIRTPNARRTPLVIAPA